MKLKKIASLALAGVMAVSMLAGCAGKTGTTDEGTNVVVATTGSAAVAQAFNDAQDADNKVKITFTADTKLESQLAQAVKKIGEGADWNNTANKKIKEALETLTGKTLATDALKAETDETSLKDGQVTVKWNGIDSSSATYWTEADAIKAAARAVNDEIAKLDADTDKDTADEGKYFTFSYTGTVAAVAVKNADGTTSYHVVYSITQTATEQTKTKG